MRIIIIALVGWLSWLQRRPLYQKLVGVITGRWSGCVQEATDGCFLLSPSPSLPLPLFLKSMDMSPGKDLKKQICKPHKTYN